MGGSRCTYRNCTVRSDGVVHMFHYPVFDKIRCHQWLVNGQRLDFLNLKLSQVRNRVVCQHHFKDECFMNYKKEKLTFDAIPTEDGPYCDKSKQKAVSVAQISNTFPITLNDYEENDKYSKINLKADPSMIYADFLTNGDAWEKQSLNETIWNNMVTTSKADRPRREIKITKHEEVVDPINTVEENHKSMITLSDLIGDTSSTKVTEFENPLLATMNINQCKDYSQVRQMRSHKKTTKVKKPNTQNKSIVKQDFTKLISNLEPSNYVINPENLYKPDEIVLQEPNFNNILVGQENNNTNVSFNNFVGTNTNAFEKISDIDIPLDVDKQMITDQNQMLQIEQPMQIITCTNDYRAIIQNPNELPIEFDPKKIVKPEDITNNYIAINQWTADQLQHKPTNVDVRKKPKITILSEKTISDPVLVHGQLEPISTTAYIHLPKKANNKSLTEIDIKFEGNDTRSEVVSSNENIPPIEDKIKQQDDCQTSNVIRKNKSNEVSPKPLVVKHKIAPERVAAIEKKRNFNKKLRDIIEICLDKLDGQDKTNEDAKVCDSSKLSDPKEKAQILKQNIGTYLSKQADLPDSQEYLMKFLEARMKKMENALLGKIEQNSQRIVELKNSITKSSLTSKIAATQTNLEEESYKKHLYHEISKFLSPNANSLVYEELFINKYGPQLSKSPSKKRKLR